jgi:flagellar basal body rod protein FlgG
MSSFEFGPEGRQSGNRKAASLLLVASSMQLFKFGKRHSAQDALSIPASGTVFASFPLLKLPYGNLLLRNGDYQTTLANGMASIAPSGSAGLGTLRGDALEQSNVNISQELSNLIIAQRAFEANSKSVR